jgi:hypothetical protein
MLRHDNGEPMTVKQACDAAWDQYGAAAVIAELAGRLAWNAKFEAPSRAEIITKDAESLAKIAERLGRWEVSDNDNKHPWKRGDVLEDKDGQQFMFGHYHHSGFWVHRITKSGKMDNSSIGQYLAKEGVKPAVFDESKRGGWPKRK